MPRILCRANRAVGDFTGDSSIYSLPWAALLLSGAGILLAAICLLIPANSATHQAFQPVRGESKKKKTQYDEKSYAQ